jgi:hypothetical protein
MSPTLLSPRPSVATKPAPIFSGKISPSGTATGIITMMPAPADQAKLVILNSLGDVASETIRDVADHGMVALNYNQGFLDQAGKELYFLVVKGYLKGSQVWEQRLGRMRFHT